MTKKKFIILFFLAMPSHIIAAELNLKLDSTTKDQFFLIHSLLDVKGVSIDKQGNMNQNIFDSTSSIINFQNTISNNEHLKQKNITLIKDSHLGKTSALFYNKDSYLEFKYFGSFDTGFFIEFWLKPFTTEIGTIFSTQHLALDGPNKTLEISFQKGYIVFKFENLFMSYKNKNIYRTITLKSNTLISPDKWASHKLKYDPANGQLNYYLNGFLNNQSWAKNEQTSESSLLYLDIPKESQFVIGKGYRGLMDQLIISSENLDNTNGNIYEKSFIITKVFDLKKIVAITSFSTNSLLPKDTGIKIEYRDSLTPFSESTPDSVIEWKEFDSKTSLHRIKARYSQMRLTLFRDPTLYKSPVIRSIGIRYQPLDVPIKPIEIKAISSRGNILLSFAQGVAKNISFYRIYIGTKRNQYLGEPNSNLESPIVVSVNNINKDFSTNRISHTINDLTVDTLYFIRLTTVSDDGVESPPSNEVSVRVKKN